ncbi:DUF6801 domain-containing protein [Thermomonospora umbrina]|uniref:DUF6801 domain-containing protein n=1 Tax=Thermomonospora umbrina TaxID=111806 RepID=A0A3D9T208_9ACTN|nr:DUF6801 domain-containing protein [Thermomonospora umbrina]REE97871.1 hypothetical protein DFJ69_3346 [Thermomonospora umbrina]
MVVAAAVTTLAVTVSGAPSAGALPPEDVPEIGVDTGRFKLPIGCKITLRGFPVFYLPTDVDVQGVAPVQLGPGQEFWLTQGSGSITFPAWLTALAPILGITKADAKITDLSIGASGSTPESINIAKEKPFEIKDIPIEAAKPLKVGLPLSGQPPFEVGPFKAPGAGATTLKFDRAIAEVALKSTLGFALNIKADCTASQGNALLKLGIGGPAGQPPIKIQGAPLNFPEPATNALAGIIHAPYSCTLDGERHEVGVAVGADHIPLTVKRNGSFSFERASGALTIPAATVNRLLDKGYRTAAGKVTTLNLNVEGGVPNVQNVAAGGIDIPETPLVRDQKIVVSLPANGLLTAGPFKPAAGAGSVAVSLGEAAATFTFNGSTQTTATCGTPSPTVYLVENPVT